MWKNGIFGTPGVACTDSDYQMFDDKEQFHKNLQVMPDDWEYRNKKMNYCYNSYGHRSVEPSMLSDGYLLFLGCSITEGVGVALEDSYSNIVAKATNSQYYNLGISGSGIDMTAMNAIQFITFTKIKPSKVIIQWNELSRFYMIDESGYPHLYNLGSMHTNPNLIWKTMIADDHAQRKSMHYRQMLLHYLYHIDVEIYELFEMPNGNHDEKNLITSLYKDSIPTTQLYTQHWPPDETYDDTNLARDRAHPGSKLNRIWAKDLLSAFSQNTL